MTKFISMAQLRHEIVDCRMLQLELEFHHLDRTQVGVLAEICVNQIHKLTSDIFYLEWVVDNKRVSKSKLLSNFSDSEASCDFIFEGDVYSNIVKDHKSFKKYCNEMLHCSKSANSYSSDYPEAFHKHFNNANNPEKLKAAILNIFQAEGRAKKAVWNGHDIKGLLFTCPYRKLPNQFYGNFNCRIALECLGTNTITYAQRLKDFAVHLAEEIPFVSGRVALSPIDVPSKCSGHMYYFGGKIRSDLPKDIVFGIEWNPFYYLCGVEWCNLLSSLQVTHLPNIAERSMGFKDLLVSRLKSGCIIAQSKSSILETDVSELSSLKKFLYPSLYPGSSQIMIEDLRNPNTYGLLSKPRQNWECVPIFEEEVTVGSDRIIFSHQSHQAKVANSLRS